MGISREEFFERAKPKWKECEVQGIGMISVRQITAREQQSYIELRGSEDVDQRRRSIWWVIAQAVLAPDGSRLFGDGDVERIGTLEAEAVARVFLEIMRFSDADAEAVERAGESSAETATPSST